MESRALAIGRHHGRNKKRKSQELMKKIAIPMLSGCRIVLARAGTGSQGNRRIFGTFYLFGCRFLENSSLRGGVLSCRSAALGAQALPHPHLGGAGCLAQNPVPQVHAAEGRCEAESDAQRCHYRSVPGQLGSLHHWPPGGHWQFKGQSKCSFFI